jgi:general secretion pathway protein I
MMRQIDGSVYLRDKLLAEWVALNQLELALLANRHSNQLPAEKTTGSEEMAGRTWYWQAQRQRSQADGFVQLDISVSADENTKTTPLATIAAVLDQYHRLP